MFKSLINDNCAIKVDIYKLNIDRVKLDFGIFYELLRVKSHAHCLDCLEL